MFIISAAFSVLHIYCVITFKTEICINHDVFSTLTGLIFGRIISYAVYALRVSNYFAKKELTHMSSIDGLTGILNKISFERISSDYINYRDNSEPFTFIILDADNFKSVNDSRGHETGDNLLKLIGVILSSQFRHNDIVGRIGGDEFCILLTGTASDSVIEEKIQTLRTLLNTRIPARLGMNVTFSFGICLCTSKDNVTFSQCYKKADEALYKIKDSGKNAVGKIYI